MAIQGSLQSITIPELFSLLHQLRGTGVLSVVNESDERGFLFYHGNLVYATGKDDSRRLGKYLARLGFLSSEELEDEFYTSPGAELYLGQRLVEGGRITATQLHDSVKAQILDIMGEVMAWGLGAFHFDDMELPFAIPDDTVISTQSVLFEASRMADEHGYAESILPERNAVLSREDWSPTGKMDAEHREVLDRIDGERTVEQILFSSSFGSKATVLVLKDLLEWGAVRQSGVLVPEEGSPPVPELSSLPVAPQVPVRLFSVFDRADDDEQLQGICELLAQEPMLTAKVVKMLRLHNVEIRRSQMNIENLVHLLGPFHLRCSLLPEAARGIFLSEQLTFWRVLWEYSQIAAHLSRELASAAGYMFPGEAFLAGLLHKLGVFLLLHADPEKYLGAVRQSLCSRQDLLEIEEELFGISQTRIGAIHAEKWRFPRMLLLAIKHHHYRLDARPANPLLHIVNVAGGTLHAGGLVLGFQEGAEERFEHSLKRLQIDREQAMSLLDRARHRALQEHYLGAGAMPSGVPC